MVGRIRIRDGPRVENRWSRGRVDRYRMLLEVQCEVSTVCDDLGCHVICWCWSTVFSEVHSQCSHIPVHFRALHASFCWQALWKCWFHFPAGFGTCPHCQRYQKLVQWPWCYCAWLASKHAWPKPRRESMGYCQEEWMNEWMMHLYSAFCVLLYTQKRFTIMWGVSPQPPPVCSIHLDDATAATGQRHQCAHHTPATDGEERER